MARAVSQPEKERYSFVTFTYGDLASPTVSRYTDWTQSTMGFVSTPGMEVEVPENTGIFEERELEILLPADAFSLNASNGLPHSPIFVRVQEQTSGLIAGDAGSLRTLFAGRIMRTIRNFQGRSNTVAFFALPIKSRLAIPMGLQCNHHCVWRLFGPGCQLTQSVHDQPGQIAAIDGKEVTISTPNAAITAPAAPGGDNSRFWERGFLERDGLKIGVHLWTIADPAVFVLRRRPPDSWLLAGASSVLFVPGCHNTIEDCRDVWVNEEHFGGAGFAIPSYNPIIETP